MSTKCYEQKDGRLIVNIKDSAENTIFIDLSELLVFGDDISKALVEAMSKYCLPYNSLRPAKTLRTLLKVFGGFFKHRLVTFDDSSSVYSALFDFRKHWFTTALNNQRIDVRNATWDIFRGFIKFLMDDGVIAQTYIPPGNPKLHNRNVLAANRQSLLIAKKGEKAELVTSLVPISLARSDGEYLLELENNLKSARDTFLDCARAEINNIKAAKKEGKELIDGVNYPDLLKIVEESFQNYRPYNIKNYASYNVHLFGPKHPDGYKHVLARVHHEHNGYYPLSIGKARNCTDLALSRATDVIPSAKCMGSHLGLLTVRGAIPFFVFLLLKNAKFNVESLAKIEVTGKNGVTRFLSTAGDESKTIRMKVKKGRASSEKSEILDDETKEVITLLLELTEPYRKHLEKIGDPSFNKLWIVGKSTGVGNPIQLLIGTIRKNFGSKAYRENDFDKMSSGDVGVTKNSFLLSHEKLKPYIGVATLSRLRTTLGLIEWFESGGDAKAVARALGNSVKVTIDHYIPKSLQIMMNRRLIRRFQNLLIIAATASESFTLECSDFCNIEDLHSFLAQMLDGGSGTGNELLIELQRKSGLYSNASIDCNLDHEKKIAIKVSSTNLAMLILYQAHMDCFNSAHVKNSDEKTGTSPEFWYELSKSLQYTILNDISKREFIPIYESALSKVESLRATIKFPKTI